MQPDGRLIVLAIALALAAGLVSLSLFEHASRGSAGRRLGWVALAAVCGAFGIWAAHFVAVLAHRFEIRAEFALPAMAASLLSISLVTYAGFTVAARAGPWRAPTGGAITGTGMSLMHYIGLYAVAVPGVLEWDFPLVLSSVGLGAGFSSAALTVYRRFKGPASFWTAASLLAMAFFSLHVTGMHAVHGGSPPPVVLAMPPHHGMLATILVVAAIVVLLLGFVSTLIDRLTVHENVELMQQRRATEAELQSRNRVLQEREEELKARNLQLDTALRHMSLGLCMYDKDERVILSNERFASIYGLAPEQIRPGMRRREIIERRIAAGVWAGASAEAYMHERTQPITTTGCIIQEMSDGRYVVLTHVPMPGGGWVCTHEDITEQRRAQTKIEHLARHDGLTDLPNRVFLRERLQEALSRLRPGDGLAVHCLDLDRFKEVNDALGHAIGDELLQQFAARLKRAVGAKDTLARVGGDEFVIVQDHAASPRDAVDLAAEIIAAMSEPFTLGAEFQVVLGASIGIAMAPDDGTDADQLLKNANLALSRAKEEERGKYRFFETAMDARVRARHELERNLRGALANGELDLAYQPLLNLKRNEIACFEALLRWRMPDGTAIEPSEFVPLAEETGLILPLGEWALRQALAEAARWPRQIRVAVNLSPVQFNARNLPQVVMSALAASGVEPSRLELEITESLLLQERETTLATLHQLRDLGVRVALDDFGTGFSSLNYLRAFPFDKLKIDQCFIAGLAEGNEESLAIVRAVARLGRSLGITTTAEGVETREQMEIARKEGFTEIQGFWLSVPKSAAMIAQEYDLYRPTRKPRRAAATVKPAAAKKGKTAAAPAAVGDAKSGGRVRKARGGKRARSA